MWRQSGGQRAAEPVEAVLGPILDFSKVDVKALGKGLWPGAGKDAMTTAGRTPDRQMAVRGNCFEPCWRLESLNEMPRLNHVTTR